MTRRSEDDLALCPPCPSAAMSNVAKHGQELWKRTDKIVSCHVSELDRTSSSSEAWHRTPSSSCSHTVPSSYNS
jgi:hypothetical protein